MVDFAALFTIHAIKIDFQKYYSIRRMGQSLIHTAELEITKICLDNLCQFCSTFDRLYKIRLIGISRQKIMEMWL